MMKRRLLPLWVVVSLGVSCSAVRQRTVTTKSAAAPKFLPLISVLRSSMMSDRINWEAYSVGVKGTKPHPSAAVADSINRWVDENRGIDAQTFANKEARIQNMTPAERAAVIQYEDPLIQFFHKAEFVGYARAQFLYDSPREIPVRFAVKDGQPVILITGFASETVYNILRLTSKERAARAISSSVLPSLEYFDVALGLGHTSSRYFGMEVAYGSRDPTEDEVVSLKAETVAVIVDSALCHQFVQGTLTQEELLRRSDVYLSDRSTVFDVSKVELNLQ